MATARMDGSLPNFVHIHLVIHIQILMGSELIISTSSGLGAPISFFMSFINISFHPIAMKLWEVIVYNEAKVSGVKI